MTQHILSFFTSRTFLVTVIVLLYSINTIGQVVIDSVDKIPQIPTSETNTDRQIPKDTFLFDLVDMSLADILKREVVTAAKTKQKSSDVPASIVVVTRKNIEQAGYKDLNEILENIPGFYSLGNAYNEGGTNFGVRGFSSGGALTDFLIMINGVSQIQDFSNSFSTDKINIPVEAIERIEVVRGPNAVMYGSSAFMGAVNIITNEVTPNSKSTVVATTGSNQTHKAAAHLVGNIEGLTYVVNASIKSTEGLNAKYSDMQSDTNIIKSWGLPANATTQGQYAGTQKYFEISTKYKDLNFMILNTFTELGTPPSKPSANTDIGFKLKTYNSIFSARYKKQISTKFKANGRFSYYNFTQSGDPHFNYPQSYNLFTTNSNGYDIELTGTYQISKRIEILLGINNHTALDAGRKIDITTSSSAFRDFGYQIADKDNMVTNALFTQVTIEPIKKLTIVAGIRVEKTNAFDITGYNAYLQNPAINKDTTVALNIGKMNYDQPQFVPRLASIYRFNDNNILKFMYGKSIKRPSILENVNITSRSLNGLNFAEMETYELNYTSVFAKNFMVSFNAYYNDLNNLILRNVAISSTDIITTQSVNAGKMKTYGLELNTVFKIIEKLTVDVSVVYQTTENHTINYTSTASYSPNLLGYLNLNYTVHKYNFCLYGSYVDKMKAGWNVNTDPNKSAWYGKEVSDYLLMNFNFRANKIWQGLFATFNISNILDTQIHYPTTPNSSWTDKGMLGYGRRFQLGLGYNF